MEETAPVIDRHTTISTEEMSCSGSDFASGPEDVHRTTLPAELGHLQTTLNSLLQNDILVVTTTKTPPLPIVTGYERDPLK